MLLSLNRQRAHKQPTTGGPPHNQPPRQYTSARMCASTKRAASTCTKKKRAIVRRRQKNLHSSQDKNRAQKVQHQPTPAAMGSECFEYSSSSDQNINSSNSSSPAGGVEPFCFPQKTLTGTQDHRRDGGPPISTETVIRQRVEKHEDQVEVSLEGLWLPALSSAPGFRSPGTAAGRRCKRFEGGGASTAEVGHWAESSTSTASYSSTMLSKSTSPARKNGNVPVDGGRRHRTSSSRTRPVTVDSQTIRRHVLSRQHERNTAGGVMTAARSRPDNRRAAGTGETEGNDQRGYDGMTRRSDDDCDDHDGHGTSPLMEQPMWEGTSGYGASGRGGSTMARNISRDTATMLKRSHTLVARAKVSAHVSFSWLPVGHDCGRCNTKIMQPSACCYSRDAVSIS